MTRVISLLPDDRLSLLAGDAVLPLVQPWVPLTSPSRVGTTADLPGDISVHGAVETSPPATDHGSPVEPLLRLGSVRALRRSGNVIALCGTGDTMGSVDVNRRRASIEVGASGLTTDAASDVYSMLTISAAFVLGLRGMALVHAGAVVDRAGDAWLIVGDSHSGKTSTCTALVDTGWSFLSDDQVVLAREGDGIVAYGWPRVAHLDSGWARGAITGTRDTVRILDRWPARVMSVAPLRGVLLPQVRAAEPTTTTTAHPAAVLTALIRQSPWLVAEPLVAAQVLKLLESLAGHTAHHLLLGRDSYARGDVLESRLERGW